MVLQNRLKGSSFNQAHQILKWLVSERNRSEVGGYPSIISIKFELQEESLLHRKDK